MNGFLPTGGVIILGRSHQELQALARNIGDAFRSRPDPTIPEGMILDTPIGPLQLAVRDNRMVAANDPALLQHWLDGVQGSDPLAPEQTLLAEVDLPTLAPFLNLLAGLKVDPPRMPGAIDRVGSTLAEVALAQIQAKATTLGSGLTGEALPIERSTGKGSVRLDPQDALLLAQELTPPPGSSTDAAATAAVDATSLEQRFAWYAPAAEPVRKVALVFRSAGGWHLLDDWRKGWTKPFNRGAIVNRLGNFGCPRVVGGTEIDKLLVSQLPPSIGSWLPPLPILGPNLPPWSLSVQAVPGGLHSQELGLPLATGGLMGASWWSWRVLGPRLAASAATDDFQ